MVMCMDAFTCDQTRLVVIVDSMDSCEQDKVLQVLNSPKMKEKEKRKRMIEQIRTR